MPWKLLWATQFEKGEDTETEVTTAFLALKIRYTYLIMHSPGVDSIDIQRKKKIPHCHPKHVDRSLEISIAVKEQKGVGVKKHARRGRLKKSTELQWISLAFLQQLFLSHPGCQRPFQSVFKIPFREILYSDPRIAKRKGFSCGFPASWRQNLSPFDQCQSIRPHAKKKPQPGCSKVG